MASRTYPDEKDGRRSVLDKNSNPQGETPRTRASSEVAVEDAPERDYPRYLVEPGERVSLAAIDPDETEHYRKKKEVAKE